jgi:Lrp/AsnC family transcriptional regulator
MTEKIELDTINKRILGLLQDDATMPIQQIAERVGLSVNPCWRRIKLLEEHGVIERRVALVNAAAVGLGVTAFVSIRTNQHNSKWLESFAKGVQRIPEIVECHRMSGDIDYLLKVVVRDIQHYDRVYRKLIAVVPGLSDVSSTFSMESLKQSVKLDLLTQS